MIEGSMLGFDSISHNYQRKWYIKFLRSIPSFLAALSMMSEAAAAGEVILRCREIDGVEMTSQLVVDLDSKRIRWIWHEMYRDYSITRAGSTVILAESEDPVFQYMLSVDRESLVYTESRKSLFIPGSDWKKQDPKKCWLSGEEPKPKI